MTMPILKTILETEPVVKIENTCLRYYVPRERIRSFKEYAIRKVQGKIVNEEFWALRDISFTVNKGEVFGIIGENGAGKSTLLKMVARVLRPTSGRVWVSGNVAPLLSVGAGFHQELTGRENVFLNGTLLGFTQKQMKEKFGAIVEFAGLESFIDAPIRTYSSGMVARLGFAVATDSKPDILIVDEVLAVGDEAFQAKCFERIETYQAQGMTTLLVTHNSERIRKMCHRVAWLEKGTLKMLGAVDDVVNDYIQTIKPGIGKPGIRKVPEKPFFRKQRF
jgi:ABC-2 type transport system ATP-binding protein/lipopolysaccharide transport system ATP-binding protein